MKRIISYLLSVLLIIGCMPIMSISAVGSPKYIVNDATVQVNDIFTVDVSIEDNPGIISLRLKVVYDSSVIELQSVTDTGLLKGFTNPSPTISSPYTLRWADSLSTVDNSNQGAVVKLTFKALSTGQTNVTIEHGEARKSSGKKVAFENAVAEITIEDKAVPVTGVTIDETISINIGEKKTPTYTVQPGNASNKAVSFVLSDPSVASVNETTGEITGITKGTATVTVTTADGGFSDTCAVTVICPHTTKTQFAEKASTCTEQGWDTYSKCNICDQLFNAEGDEIAAIPYRALLAHTNGDPVRENEIAASCEEAGSYDEVVYCTVCHTEISRNKKTIQPLEHDWDEGTVTTPATCTADGVRTYTCKYDASHTYTETIPATGHTPAEAVRENKIAATCSAAGSYDEVVYCSVCHEEVSREQKTIPIDEDAHDWGEWVQTKTTTEMEPGEETRTCKHNPKHTETREIPALGPSQVELSFLDDEVIIVVPNDATPDGSVFDVQKIVPPPAEIVEKVKEQMGSSSEVLAYYEVRLTAADGTSIIHLDSEITIKVKMPEQYVGSKCVRILQEDETGKLIVMESCWEGEYLCFKTDWLEIYN